MKSVSCVVVVALVPLVACSDPPEPSAPAAGSPSGAQSGSGAGSGSGSGSGTQNPLAPTDDGDACKLAAIDANGVEPTFKVYDPAAGVAPPAMTGGAIEGKWKVDAATVYLPNEVKAAVKPAESTGTLTSWAHFKKNGYRLVLKTDFSIASIAGPRPQQSDVAAGGTFKANGPLLEFENNACNPQAEKQEAEFSFSDQGDRGLIVIKTKTEFGFSYLELQAARSK